MGAIAQPGFTHPCLALVRSFLFQSPLWLPRALGLGVVLCPGPFWLGSLQGPTAPTFGVRPALLPMPHPEISSQGPSDPTTPPLLVARPMHLGPDRCPPRDPLGALLPSSSHSMDTDLDQLGSAALKWDWQKLPRAHGKEGRKQPSGGEILHPCSPQAGEVLPKPSEGIVFRHSGGLD